jgi:hypothetical protein
MASKYHRFWAIVSRGCALSAPHQSWISDAWACGWLAGADLKLRDRITVLTTVPKYTATNKEAARLLTALPQTAGFLWPSKQTGEDGAYVFYQPPTASDDFEVIETIPLDSPMGAQLIDQALARAHMRRLDALALEQELVSQLRPDIDEDD